MIDCIGTHVPGRGLATGTCIHTQQGWRPIETLRTGDPIRVMDGGTQPLRRIVRQGFGGDLSAAFPDGLILVPRGTLGARETFYLPPETRLVLTGEAVEALTHDSAALVRAGDLPGCGGIGRALPVDGITLIALEFEHDTVIRANGDFLVHCPANPDASDHAEIDLPILGTSAARTLLTELFFSGTAAAA